GDDYKEQNEPPSRADALRSDEYDLPARLLAHNRCCFGFRHEQKCRPKGQEFSSRIPRGRSCAERLVPKRAGRRRLPPGRELLHNQEPSFSPKNWPLKEQAFA